MHTHSSWYLNDLDVLVVAPDGKVPAFYIGWLLVGASSEGQELIEPLDYHTGYHSNAWGWIALC